MRKQKNDILSFLPKGLIFYLFEQYSVWRKCTICLVFISLSSPFLFAQSDQNKLSPSDLFILKTANEKYNLGDFYDAIPSFTKLLISNPTNLEIQFKYGVCITEVAKDQQKAIPFLKKAFNNGISQASFYLGKVYFNYMQFDSAHFYLNSFISRASKNDLKKTDAENMVNRLFDAMMLMNQASKVKVRNVEEVNSSFADYSPIIKADNSVLYFTSKREDSKGQKQDENGQYYEDIYVSKKEDSLFLEPENTGSSLNSKEHDATLALSADGNTIIIYRTDPYAGDGDFYMSRKYGNDWEVPFKLGLHINSQFQETSASLSPDGNILYFTSNRPGGYGGLDIYKSERGKNGVWGMARNLGSTINTKFDEESPFINSDQKVLYFSSKGHEPNMGGFDVFKSKIDSNGKWQKPINMQYPVNTLKDDLYFTLTADANIGYACSNRIDSKGDLDIYQFELDEQSPNITVFSGTVFEENTTTPMKAHIEIFNTKTGKPLYHCFSNELTGQFLTILPNDIDLKIIFEKGNAIFTELFESNQSKKFRAINKVIELPNQ